MEDAESQVGQRNFVAVIGLDKDFAQLAFLEVDVFPLQGHNIDYFRDRCTNLATSVIAIRVPIGNCYRYIHATPDWSATEDIFYLHRINFRLVVILRIPKPEM